VENRIGVTPCTCCQAAQQDLDVLVALHGRGEVRRDVGRHVDVTVLDLELLGHGDGTPPIFTVLADPSIVRVPLHGDDVILLPALR
jgi:hypothetical protein